MKRLVKLLATEFLVVIAAVLYLVAAFDDPSKAARAAAAGMRVLVSVLPIVAAVFLALGLFGVWVNKKAVADRLGEGSGFVTLVLAALFGTVLVGPVYVVFPLLKTVREHGARWAVIGVVLAAWAVKIPMIPLEIGLLGWRFSLSRSLLIAVCAIPLGLLLELAMRLGNRSSEPGPEVGE